MGLSIGPDGIPRDPTWDFLRKFPWCPTGILRGTSRGLPRGPMGCHFHWMRNVSILCNGLARCSLENETSGLFVRSITSSHEIFQDLPWNPAKFRGKFLWDSMEKFMVLPMGLHGALWDPMEPRGSLSDPIGIRMAIGMRSQGDCDGSHGALRTPMDSRGVGLGSGFALGSHGFPRGPMGPWVLGSHGTSHGTSWNSLEFHGRNP